MEGQIYSISNEFFKKFKNENLMKNKVSNEGTILYRPCYLALNDEKPNIFWMIPISSNVSKYKNIIQSKIDKYGKCNTIVIGTLFRKERAYLIQNMFPVSKEYLKSYFNNSVIIDNATKELVIKNTITIKNLVFYKNMDFLVYANIKDMYKELIHDLEIKQPVIQLQEIKPIKQKEEVKYIEKPKLKEPMKATKELTLAERIDQAKKIQKEKLNLLDTDKTKNKELGLER